MPIKCSVKGCGGSGPGKSFFFLPAVLKYKYSKEKVELSKERRKLWLEAIGAEDDGDAVKIRVCSDHFLTGRPSALDDSTNIDWVPSLHMKLPSPIFYDKHKGKQKIKKFAEAGSLGATPLSLKDNLKNYNLRKGESKKLLNCKVLLDGNLRCTSFNGTNGSGLAIIQKHGKFTSDNVTLRETAINNTVLRVRLIREDLYDLQRRCKSIKRKRKESSSFGRQIKKKSYSFGKDDYNYTPVNDFNSVSPKVGVKESPRDERSVLNMSNSFRSLKGDKRNKLQGKLTPSARSSVQNKTLNRVIKRNDKDKIKVKFFPKTSTPNRGNVNNGTIQKVPEKPLHLHREILFVKPIWTNELAEPTYYLKFTNNRGPINGSLSYPFQKLVMDVKHMKLPGPTWKIKVIIRQGRISAITFTNKKALERSIAFSASSNLYNIVIDNRPCLLLGAPQNLRCADDLEILLDIVENIDATNPMILYK